MKAIQISHSQELNVIDIEKPQAPGQGEILLKLHYVGFCGSDINTFMGWVPSSKPSVPMCPTT